MKIYLLNEKDSFDRDWTNSHFGMDSSNTPPTRPVKDKMASVDLHKCHSNPNVRLSNQTD